MFESVRGDGAPFVAWIAHAIDRESVFDHIWSFSQGIGTAGRFQATRRQIIDSKCCTRDVKSRLSGWGRVCSCQLGDERLLGRPIKDFLRNWVVISPVGLVLPQ